MRNLVTCGLAVSILVLMPLVSFAGFTDGLLLYLPFDEGSGEISKDLSGNDHNGQINLPEWVDGKFGKALKFGGENSGTFVTIESTPMLNVNEMTFTAWINAEHWDGIRQIVGKSVHGGCAGRAQYGLFSEGGTFRLRFETEAGRVDIHAPALPATNEWVHVAFTNDGITAKIFINGDEVAIGDVPGPLKTTDDPLRIAQDCERQNYIFAGSIDEITIWNLMLSADEITAIMNNALISLVRVMTQKISPRTIGDTFSLGVEAATSDSLHTFTFNLTFDPTILRAISVDSGPFLSNNGIDPITCEAPQIDNATGRITGISCQRDDADGISGEGVLAGITFEAIKVGESALQIENASFTTPDGNPIEFSTEGSTVSVFGPHGTITGRVIDFEGNPVSGVEVSALKSDLPIGIVGKTDSDGNYVIENITEAGSVTVRAINPGLIPGVAENVTVQISQTTADIDLILPEPTALHSVVDSEGFIRNWLLLGPIPWENDGNRLISDQFSVTDPDLLLPPQEQETRELLPSEGEYGSGLAKTRRWILHVDSDGDIDFASLYGQIKGVGYAFTSVKSPLEQEVTLQLGSGDGIAVWLNGKLAHLNNVGRGREIDQDAVPKLTLQKGWNSLLIKVENQNGDWGFLARFAGRKSLLADLEPIIDLEISPQWPRVDSGLTQGTFNLALLKGLNMISLPVRPDTPLTAQALIDKLSATVLTKLDATRQTFVPYLPFPKISLSKVARVISLTSLKQRRSPSREAFGIMSMPHRTSPPGE